LIQVCYSYRYLEQNVDLFSKLLFLLLCEFFYQVKMICYYLSFGFSAPILKLTRADTNVVFHLYARELVMLSTWPFFVKTSMYWFAHVLIARSFSLYYFVVEVFQKFLNDFTLETFCLKFFRALRSNPDRT